MPEHIQTEREWEATALYEVGETIVHDGVRYRITCPEHGSNCPGGGSLRAGFLPPPLCIEDGVKFYEVVDESA